MTQDQDAAALLTERAADKQTIADRTVERDELERVSVQAIEYAQELEAKITKLEASQLPEGCVAISAVRLSRDVRDGGLDRVTVDVEYQGRWIEVISELHSNYFNHYVSNTGIEAEALRSKDPSHV